MTLIFVVIVTALVFEFINGFHDTANSIATVVATRVLHPRQAVVLAAVTNLIGALWGTAVATTIAAGIIDPRVASQEVLICALLGAIIQVNATCDPDMDVSLSGLRNHLLIGLTEREVQSEETISLDGREALRTHVVAKLDGVPREMMLTVLKKDGCVYDFMLIGANDSAGVSAFERFVHGFATLS